MSKPSGWRSDLTFKLRKSYLDSRLGVTRVMAIHPFRQQPLSAALPAPGQRRPTSLGSHPGAETVLAFPSSLRWLVGPFHKARKICSAQIKNAYLKMEPRIVNLLGREWRS